MKIVKKKNKLAIYKHIIVTNNWNIYNYLKNILLTIKSSLHTPKSTAKTKKKTNAIYLNKTCDIHKYVDISLWKKLYYVLGLKWAL